MNFPQQIRQHKNESDSFAIILYKLRELGIFRNVTSHDYGIDFEIELVEDGRVCGHCVKVQVKSSDDLNIKQDGHPTIGGIKQTTLRYWAELSYSIPVIALCVDLKTETVYMTNPLFWQAISLLDATKSSKTIEFIQKTEIEEIIDRIRTIAKSYSLREELLAHKWFLRNMRGIFDMYNDLWWLDRECQNVEIPFFKTFLENVRVLLTPIVRLDKEQGTVSEKLFTFDYYYGRSEVDGPYNYVIYEGIRCFFLLLLRVLDCYRKRVLVSGYFWAYHDDDYLKLVAGTRIPTFNTEQELKDFDYDDFFSKESISGWFSTCLSQIEQRAKAKDSELVGYLVKKYGRYIL